MTLNDAKCRSNYINLPELMFLFRTFGIGGPPFGGPARREPEPAGCPAPMRGGKAELPSLSIVDLVAATSQFDYLFNPKKSTLRQGKKCR